MKKDLNKYCLGTAQLGIKGYGINNSSLELPKGENFFDLILQEDIPNIDTSVYYGEIENIIANYDRKSYFIYFTF